MPARVLPRLPEPPRKNDALFMAGALGPLPAVYTYMQETTEVVHGPSCRPEAEIRLDACARDKVGIAARRGGGGTVVLSPGTAVIVLIGERRRDEDIRRLFSRIHAPIIEVLGSSLGLPVEECGLSDLAVGGRKILGSSLYLSRRPSLFFYQASLLVSCDLGLLDRYLEHPPKEPDYRRGRGHRDFCTTLAEIGLELPAEEVGRLIAEGIRGGF